MHCLNPDRLVIRGGVPEACAGAIADLYQMLGGRVTWYGKPHEAIYAMRCISPAIRRRTRCWRSATGFRPTCSARRGWASTPCSSRAGSTPASRSRRISPTQNGLGGWQPVAVVDGLA